MAPVVFLVENQQDQLPSDTAIWLNCSSQWKLSNFQVRMPESRKFDEPDLPSGYQPTWHALFQE